MKYLAACANDGDDEVDSKRATTRATAAIAAKMVLDVDGSGHLLQMLFSK